MILGYQILMILSDFGGPGAHLLMIFEYFGCLGTLPGGLGHILKPKLDFGDISAAKGQSLFGVKMRHEPTFGNAIFQCFFECSFFSIMCDLECPEAPFWEAFGGHFGSFF